MTIQIENIIKYNVKCQLRFMMSFTFYTSISDAPKFTDEYDSVEVVTGGNVSFGCSAEGNPPPEVKCKYTVAINARETTRGRQHTVSITRATSANGGIYNCVATNEVGTATWQTTLTITPLGIDCRVIIN